MSITGTLLLLFYTFSIFNVGPHVARAAYRPPYDWMMIAADSFKDDAASESINTTTPSTTTSPSTSTITTTSTSSPSTTTATTTTTTKTTSKTTTTTTKKTTPTTTTKTTPTVPTTTKPSKPTTTNPPTTSPPTTAVRITSPLPLPSSTSTTSSTTTKPTTTTTTSTTSRTSTTTTSSSKAPTTLTVAKAVVTALPASPPTPPIPPSPNKPMTTPKLLTVPLITTPAVKQVLTSAKPVVLPSSGASATVKVQQSMVTASSRVLNEASSVVPVVPTIAPPAIPPVGPVLVNLSSAQNVETALSSGLQNIVAFEAKLLANNLFNSNNTTTAANPKSSPNSFVFFGNNASFSFGGDNADDDDEDDDFAVARQMMLEQGPVFHTILLEELNITLRNFSSVLPADYVAILNVTINNFMATNNGSMDNATIGKLTRKLLHALNISSEEWAEDGDDSGSSGSPSVPMQPGDQPRKNCGNYNLGIIDLRLTVSLLLLAIHAILGTFINEKLNGCWT